MIKDRIAKACTSVNNTSKNKDKNKNRKVKYHHTAIIANQVNKSVLGI